MFSLAVILAACGGPATPAATPTPAGTPTPRATFLPTVATQVPYGTTDRPFQVVLVPPADSSETGTALATFLKDRTGLTFKVNVVTTNADVLSELCGPVPTFAWVDGWTMLAAQTMGCGNAVLSVKRGDATGLKSDIVISPAAAVDSLVGLRNSSKRRDYCRIDSQDTVSWVLPAVLMHSTTGFDPLTEFRTLKDYPDVQSILADVAGNNCVSAIASGTLENYKIPNILKIKDNVKILATTPELPFGGLMVSASVPPAVADQVTTTFTSHVDALKGLVEADELVPMTVSDMADLIKTFQGAGLDFVALSK